MVLEDLAADIDKTRMKCSNVYGEKSHVIYDRASEEFIFDYVWYLIGLVVPNTSVIVQLQIVLIGYCFVELGGWVWRAANIKFEQ